MTARLDYVLKLCSRFLFQGASYMPQAQNEPLRCGPAVVPLCAACLRDPVAAANCRRAALSAAYQSLQTGEPHYSRCWLGLNTVVLAVAPAGQLVGAVELGGFHFPEEAAANEAFIRSSLRNLAPATAEHLSQHTRSLQTIAPRELRGAAVFLFDLLFSSGVNQVEAFRENREKHLQQRRIAELLQSYDGQTTPAGDVFELFSGLVLALRTQDRDRVMLLLDDFFNRVLLMSGANSERLKVHAHMLLAVLAREEVLHQRIPFDTVMINHFNSSQELERQVELEDICYWTFRQVDAHIQRLQEPPAPREAEDLVTRVLNWLDANYARKVTLALAAREVNASLSSLTHTLRQRTGLAFSQHLNAVRVREAKELLVHTQEPLSMVALRCGFYDQSHFCHRFRGEVGCTPLQFRRSAWEAASRAAHGSVPPPRARRTSR